MEGSPLSGPLFWIATASLDNDSSLPNPDSRIRNESVKLSSHFQDFLLTNSCCLFIPLSSVAAQPPTMQPDRFLIVVMPSGAQSKVVRSGGIGNGRSSSLAKWTGSQLLPTCALGPDPGTSFSGMQTG